MANFFERPTVDLADAAAATKPRWEKATVNERFFGSDPVPDATPTPQQTQQVAPAADPAVLQTLQNLNQTIAQNSLMMQSMAAAQNPQNQVAAMAEFERNRAAQHQHLQRLQPPKAPDPDELVTDGTVAQQYIDNTRSWALQVARAEMQPMQQQMQALTSLAEPILADAHNRAWESAVGELQQRGHSAEAVPQLRQLVQQVAEASYGQDWQAQQKFLMDPKAMRYAAEAAWESAGGKMPVRNATQPPIGTPRSSSPQSTTPVAANDPMVVQVQDRLNIELGADSLAKLARFRRQNVGA